ncbi:MAG TPA: MATE family efflux transporter [Polyangiales bacterium]|nr:MATE family efflux transporter [Polyangiales bacterium]
MAWPVALSRLGIMGMGLCDAIVVGQMAPHELPHQALGWSPTAVFLVSAIGLLTGVQVLAARALGAGDAPAAGAAFTRGLVVAAVSGVVATACLWACGSRLFELFGIEAALAEPSGRIMRVFAFSVPLHLIYVASAFFVEATQRPIAGMFVMAGANVVNLVLNLLWVPEHGAIGSAWATCGARAFLALSLTLWVLLQKDSQRFAFFRRSRSGSTVGYREFLRVGFAAALSQAAEAGAFSGMTIIAGRAGADSVATYQILLNVLAVVFMLALGLASATSVLTSEAIGRGSIRDAGRASWAGLALNTACMLIIGALLMSFPNLIASAYTADLRVVGLVAGLMPLLAACVVFDGGQAITAAALRSHRDNWFPTASHVLAYAIVMPILAIVLAELRGLGTAGLLHAIVWASVLSVGVLTSRLYVLTRRSHERPARRTSGVGATVAPSDAPGA